MAKISNDSVIPVGLIGYFIIIIIISLIYLAKHSFFHCGDVAMKSPLITEFLANKL